MTAKKYLQQEIDDLRDIIKRKDEFTVQQTAENKRLRERNWRMADTLAEARETIKRLDADREAWKRRLHAINALSCQDCEDLQAVLGEVTPVGRGLETFGEPTKVCDAHKPTWGQPNGGRGAVIESRVLLIPSEQLIPTCKICAGVLEKCGHAPAVAKEQLPTTVGGAPGHPVLADATTQS